MIGKDKINSITGATVIGKDGEKIGTVGQLYVDAHDGNPSWVSVKTGLFGHKESFIPLQDARADGDRLHVGYDKAMVKDAPRIDTDGALGPEDEDELYHYYGIGSGGAPAGTGTLRSTDDEVRPARVDADRDGRDDRFEADRGTDHDAAFTGGVDADRPAGRHRAGGDTDGVDDRRDVQPDDGSMIRSEEQARVVGTERVPTERVRLRKYLVTTNEEVTVPVQKEEVRVETDPIDSDGRPSSDRTDASYDRSDDASSTDRPDDGTSRLRDDPQDNPRR